MLAVITPENTACVGPNETRLVLQTNEPTEMDFLTRNDPSAAIETIAHLGLAARVDILWASPATVQNQLVAEIQRWNEATAAHGCFQLSSVATGTDGTNLTTASPSPGFVIIEDTNAGLYTDDNGQQVTLVAPTIGGSQTQYVSYLNNVMSDADFFMQNGFALLSNGTGFVNWTDEATSPPLAAQAYGMGYVVGHNYRFTISRSSGIWQYCVADADTGAYMCQQRSVATGTHMKADLNTSVFVENWNANSNWSSGFSYRFRAYDAYLFRNGVPQTWSAQHRHTAEACASGWPVSNAISGSLVSAGDGYFYVAGTPLFC
ncbi:MAG: hypothetical protein IT318_26360 [Anaerolineales bacterium]|nr:hypothetical protein [Anaerolineales bacterium]